MVYNKSVVKHVLSMLGGEHFLRIISSRGKEFCIKFKACFDGGFCSCGRKGSGECERLQNTCGHGQFFSRLLNPSYLTGLQRQTVFKLLNQPAASN